MSTTCGIISIGMGALSFIASIIRASLSDWEKSNEDEKCAIGWFILAAVCFR